MPTKLKSKQDQVQDEALWRDMPSNRCFSDQDQDQDQEQDELRGIEPRGREGAPRRQSLHHGYMVRSQSIKIKIKIKTCSVVSPLVRESIGSVRLAILPRCPDATAYLSNSLKNDIALTLTSCLEKSICCSCACNKRCDRLRFTATRSQRERRMIMAGWLSLFV